MLTADHPWPAVSAPLLNRVVRAGGRRLADAGEALTCREIARASSAAATDSACRPKAASRELSAYKLYISFAIWVVLVSGAVPLSKRPSQSKARAWKRARAPLSQCCPAPSAALNR